MYMLVSFTQTYESDGNDPAYKGGLIPNTPRTKLFEMYSRDTRLIELKNKFDLNLHSFHNCSKETIDRYKELNKVENTEYMVFNNVRYGETIKGLKQRLKDVGCTHFMFNQDDTFSSEYDATWDELLLYVKEKSGNFMLSLGYGTEQVESGTKLFPDDTRDTFEVYHTNTKYFTKAMVYSKQNGKHQIWPMDDSPYICTIDMVDEIYGDYYFNDKGTGIGSVWSFEMNLYRKYKDTEMDRYILKNRTLLNYNIVGLNIGKKDYYIDILKRKGIY